MSRIYIYKIGYKDSIKDSEDIKWIWNQLSKKIKEKNQTNFWLKLYDKNEKSLFESESFELIGFLKSKVTPEQVEKYRLEPKPVEGMSRADLIKITRGFSEGLTNGNISQMCFAICCPLVGYLQFLEVDCQLVEGEVNTPTKLWGHYWIKLKDGKILDPTAGQFHELKLPRIYIGVIPKQYTELRIVNQGL